VVSARSRIAISVASIAVTVAPLYVHGRYDVPGSNISMTLLYWHWCVTFNATSLVYDFYTTLQQVSPPQIPFPLRKNGTNKTYSMQVLLTLGLCLHSLFWTPLPVSVRDANPSFRILCARLRSTSPSRSIESPHLAYT
jgi:hypothetical protein